MEMKAVSQALSPPHGQPRSPAPSGTGSPFAMARARALCSRHPLPSSGSGSACSSLLFLSKALRFIQQPVGFAKWQPAPQPRCRRAHRWHASQGPGWAVEVDQGCAASTRGWPRPGRCRGARSPWSEVLREPGLEMGLVEELSPPVALVLDAVAGDVPVGVRGADGTAR